MVVSEVQQTASNYKYAMKEWGFISMTCKHVHKTSL